MPEEEEDDDLDLDLDQDPESITDLNDAKMKIHAWQNEGSRKKDYMMRLQKKLQTLDADLAQKREDVESLQRTIQLEKRKHQDEEASRTREKNHKMRLQEERIRDYLSEVLYTKPEAKKTSTVFELETVLVPFIKPGDSLRKHLV